ncbi:hypothetical protein QQF64_033845 [Cirrhinus molitorella]|uniref:BEN domain-containing protein n=1 Tax=Cirrhinus molitorella TaxID=172907 RepID=A0ABR3MV19_9TELE
MSKTWVLVEWREEPPTYDIVPKKDILKKTFEPGDVVDVAYEEESSPATIIDIDENKETLRRRMFRLDGKRKKKCVPNVEKRVAKKKKIYTPTQSPSSDAEPPLKHQVIHRNNMMLMQEINSMDSQTPQSSREAQLEQEILRLKNENEQLRALNINMQQKILPILESMSQNIPPSTDSLHSQKEDSRHKNPSEKGLGISHSVLASCGRGGTSCSAMVKDLAVAVFGRGTLATHGLSGRAGNANKGTTAKPALDQDKVMLILGELNVLF